MITYTIYRLVCPIDNTVKYIGSTSIGLKKRVMGHYKSASISNQKMFRWLSMLEENNLRPIGEEIEIIKSDNRTDALQKEEYWILHYMEKGNVLFNIRKPTQPSCSLLENKNRNKINRSTDKIVKFLENKCLAISAIERLSNVPYTTISRCINNPKNKLPEKHITNIESVLAEYGYKQ